MNIFSSAITSNFAQIYQILHRPSIKTQPMVFMQNSISCNFKAVPIFYVATKPCQKHFKTIFALSQTAPKLDDLLSETSSSGPLKSRAMDFKGWTELSFPEMVGCAYCCHIFPLNINCLRAEFHLLNSHTKFSDIHMNLYATDTCSAFLNLSLSHTWRN